MAAEYNRRIDDAGRDRIEQLAVATERLVIISENQQRAIDNHSHWIDGHNGEYHLLDKRVDGLTNTIGMWSNKIEEINNTLKQLVDIASKWKGGWFVIGVIASVVMGIVSLLKAFGVI